MVFLSIHSQSELSIVPPALRIVGTDVLFVHWPVPVADLRAVVPEPLEIDTFDGTGWVSVLVHEVTDAALDAVPVSPLPTFGEVEFRTYVAYGDDAGVYFFSCDTGQQLTAAVSDLVFTLPYYPATVSVDRHHGEIIVRSRRRTDPKVRFDVTYQPGTDASPAKSGSLAEFLVERHTYFTETEPAGDDTDATELIAGHVEREPWRLASTEATVRVNSLFQSIGLDDPDATPIYHYSPRFESTLVGRDRIPVA